MFPIITNKNKSNNWACFLSSPGTRILLGIEQGKNIGTHKPSVMKPSILFVCFWKNREKAGSVKNQGDSFEISHESFAITNTFNSVPLGLQTGIEWNGTKTLSNILLLFYTFKFVHWILSVICC